MAAEGEHNGIKYALTSRSGDFIECQTDSRTPSILVLAGAIAPISPISLIYNHLTRKLVIKGKLFSTVDPWHLAAANCIVNRDNSSIINKCGVEQFFEGLQACAVFIEPLNLPTDMFVKPIANKALKRKRKQREPLVFPLGAVVEAKHRSSGYGYYIGEIIYCHGDNTYDVQFNDQSGHVGIKVREKSIQYPVAYAAGVDSD